MPTKGSKAKAKKANDAQKEKENEKKSLKSEKKLKSKHKPKEDDKQDDKQKKENNISRELSLKKAKGEAGDKVSTDDTRAKKDSKAKDNKVSNNDDFMDSCLIWGAVLTMLFMVLINFAVGVIFVASLIGSLNTLPDPDDISWDPDDLSYDEANVFCDEGEYASNEDNVGQEFEVQDVIFEVQEFYIGDSEDVSLQYEEGKEIVVVELKVLNNQRQTIEVPKYTISLIDSDGRQSDDLLYTVSDDIYSGNTIPSGVSAQGYLVFAVEETKDQNFSLFIHDDYNDAFKYKELQVEICLGEPDSKGEKEYGSDDLSIETNEREEEEQSSTNEEKNIGDVSELKKEPLTENQVRYTSDELGISITSHEARYLHYYNNCIYVGEGLSLGRSASLEPHREVSGCFNYSFSGVDEITSSTENLKIGSSRYNVTIYKLDYENEGLTPEDAVQIDDYNSDAFFHVILRGDEEEPLSEDYLAVEYFGSWLEWEKEKEAVLTNLETIEFE